jgi:hypothetical protein
MRISTSAGSGSNGHPETPRCRTGRPARRCKAPGGKELAVLLLPHIEGLFPSGTAQIPSANNNCVTKQSTPSNPGEDETLQNSRQINQAHHEGDSPRLSLGSGPGIARKNKFKPTYDVVRVPPSAASAIAVDLDCDSIREHKWIV